MNTRIAINVTKYVFAVMTGMTIGAVTRPAVKSFFKLDENKKPETIPSEDIEEEEIPEDE